MRSSFYESGLSHIKQLIYFLSPNLLINLHESVLPDYAYTNTTD